ncbi:hypothetical protein B0H13DRAFT_2273563 [Mycena leptocephala]|nr:hypothetical protein B0H13DRAFT_2273563 [Mycena leptocephala]
MPVHVRVHPPVHVHRQSQKPKAKTSKRINGQMKERSNEGERKPQKGASPRKTKLRPESHVHHVKRAHPADATTTRDAPPAARPVYAHGVGFALANATPPSMHTHSLRAQKLRPEAPKAKEPRHTPTRGSAHAPSVPAPFVHAEQAHTPSLVPRTPLAPGLETQARAIGRTVHPQARVIERTTPARATQAGGRAAQMQWPRAQRARARPKLRRRRGARKKNLKERKRISYREHRKQAAAAAPRAPDRHQTLVCAERTGPSCISPPDDPHVGSSPPPRLVLVLRLAGSMRLVPGAQHARASCPACLTHRGHARLEPNKRPALTRAHRAPVPGASKPKLKHEPKLKPSGARTPDARTHAHRPHQKPKATKKKRKRNKEAAPRKTKPHANTCASSNPTTPTPRRRRRLEGGVRPAPATPTPMGSSPPTLHARVLNATRILGSSPPCLRANSGSDSMRIVLGLGLMLRTHTPHTRPGLAGARRVIERQG